MAKRKRRELTEEEEDKLWRMYTRARGGSKFNRVGQWETFDGFKDWMVQNGWEEGLRVMRRDDSKPRTPENCYVCVPEPAELGFTAQEKKDFNERWNRAANVLRKAAGMEPLEEQQSTIL